MLYDIHQESIIHRDITASNILYNRGTREIKVIDFGLAAIAPLGSMSVKKMTQLVGTMAYISPEQTGRVSRSIDYRTDLYSLGVVLYQLATGCLPFSTDDSLEFLHMIIAKSPIPPPRHQAVHPAGGVQHHPQAALQERRRPLPVRVGCTR